MAATPTFPSRSIRRPARRSSTAPTIVDVTDPARPKYLKHIPGTAGAGEGGGAQMTRVCAGASLPRAERGKFYLLRTLGTQGHETWDVTDPAKPVLLASIVAATTRIRTTSWWECDSGIAYIVSAVPGWRVNRMTEVYDLGDPAHPVKIRDFGLPGQEPGSTGPVPTEVHGPIALAAEQPHLFRLWEQQGRHPADRRSRQALEGDRRSRRPRTCANPEIGRLEISPLVGAHTAFPMLQMPIAEFAKDGYSTRDFVMIVNERRRTNASRKVARWSGSPTSPSKPIR